MDGYDQLDPLGVGDMELLGKIWIPPKDVETTTSLMILGHCGAQGHRGCQSLSTILKARFNLDKKCAEFCNDCLVCLHTEGGKQFLNRGR
uniref:AlNc14C358G10965 protein n=1 Tax=Albugo laibachii Nc14 TaxID=890382 RepID=F0WXL4_9STRA|nr:AlNc14C358G10965 [Albugo laibachii Nc14]|eukprot:CCA26208.1 AlNc14C358G10965 [Albugo laibachii Nc14]